MENRSRLFTIVLGLLCAISIISALFMFGQVRKVETEYVVNSKLFKKLR